MRGPIGSPIWFVEKDVTLSVAKKLAAVLEARGMDVLMTRTTDTLIALSDRGRIANANHGDVFIRSMATRGHLGGLRPQHAPRGEVVRGQPRAARPLEREEGEALVRRVRRLGRRRRRPRERRRDVRRIPRPPERTLRAPPGTQQQEGERSVASPREASGGTGGRRPPSDRMRGEGGIRTLDTPFERITI